MARGRLGMLHSMFVCGMLSCAMTLKLWPVRQEARQFADFDPPGSSWHRQDSRPLRIVSAPKLRQHDYVFMPSPSALFMPSPTGCAGPALHCS